jgi:hypothetical protein
VIGTYHQISIKHLNRYLSEFQFKWNHRKSQDIFVLVIGSSLPYSALIAAQDAPEDKGPEIELDGEPLYKIPALYHY